MGNRAFVARAATIQVQSDLAEDYVIATVPANGVIPLRRLSAP
jgi:hypothetical protein